MLNRYNLMRNTQNSVPYRWSGNNSRAAEYYQARTDLGWSHQGTGHSSAGLDRAKESRPVGSLERLGIARWGYDSRMASPGQGSGLARQAHDIRLLVDTIPTMAWSASPDGSAEFFNRRWLDYAGLSMEEASDWGWTVALHPEDRVRLMDYWRRLLAFGEAGEIEARLRRHDGEYRWFMFRAEPARDNHGDIFEWYGGEYGYRGS
jgi:PAS domain S-box-containing protein